ncbi:MAG: helix-turn-helix domain-containing protein [Deltaproteobacteria bacterium]|nr:helix-turn-helix domain-containing protein [Deltaproteobacteria bacterium]
MRDARKKLRLTQSELAARLGKNRDNIAKYETGATNTPGDVILGVMQLIENDIQV